MDEFETSVGYTSLVPAFFAPKERDVRALAEEDLLKLARDSFDAELAEILRATGEWHWEIEVREVAGQVAETLSFADGEHYERLRTMLLQHYHDRYRAPAGDELKDSLKRRHGAFLARQSEPE